MLLTANFLTLKLAAKVGLMNHILPELEKY
jgi:hypothetical protein